MLDYSTPVTITTIAGGIRGQQVTFLFADSNARIQCNSHLRLSAAGTFIPSASGLDTLTLLCVDGTNWFETARSVNN
jgi:hypothetical protein